MLASDLVNTLCTIIVEEGDVDIQIAESQHDWESVLYYVPNEASADEVREIRL